MLGRSMKCCVCLLEPAHVGVLCAGCRSQLEGPTAITSEQIEGSTGMPSSAVLIDVWGGVHALSPDTQVGRSTEPDALSIYEPSVSRRHARIRRRPDGDWEVEDLGSSNGTFVDVRPAREPLILSTRNRLRFGTISFFFLADASELVLPLQGMVHAQTDTPRKIARIRLIEPSGGGAGIVEIDGKSADLTLAQYELLSLLLARKLADDGYVSSQELIGVLSLDALEPDDDNVRQLVRRVRRRLIDAGIGDVIENKYGAGYRLMITPRVGAL